MPKTYTDLQTYFDDAVAFFATMQRQCLEPDPEPGTAEYLSWELAGHPAGDCVYENPATGEHCIIGQFIPDGHIALREIGGVMSIVDDYPDLYGVAIPSCKDGLTLAIKLQVIHDRGDLWDSNGLNDDGWKELEIIARVFQLTFIKPEMELKVQENV